MAGLDRSSLSAVWEKFEDRRREYTLLKLAWSWRGIVCSESGSLIGRFSSKS